MILIFTLSEFTALYSVFGLFLEMNISQIIIFIQNKCKMLEPYRQVLNSTRIVLASASPRRKEILEKLNLDIEILPSILPEDLSKEEYGTKPHEFAVKTAEVKSESVFERIKAENSKNLLVIGCDTVVSLHETIFGKPTSVENAESVLSKLSGRSHDVYTGVHLILHTDQAVHKTSFFEKTEVEFMDMDSEIIQAYVRTGEPMDKAGGYGIQGLGGTLVKGIKGDYYNVMGFPLHVFCVHLLMLLKNIENS